MYEPEGEIRVVGDPPRDGPVPVLVLALQHVLEDRPLGAYQGRGGVVELDAPATGGQPQPPVAAHGPSIVSDLHHDGRRRSPAGPEPARVDHHDPVDGGEPQPAIGGPASRGLGPAVALRRGHPVGRAVGDGRDRPGRAGAGGVEVRLADPEDPFGATEPQVTAVLEDLADRVAIQAVLAGVGGEPAVA